MGEGRLDLFSPGVLCEVHDVVQRPAEQMAQKHQRFIHELCNHHEIEKIVEVVYGRSQCSHCHVCWIAEIKEHLVFTIYPCNSRKGHQFLKQRTVVLLSCKGNNLVCSISTKFFFHRILHTTLIPLPTNLHGCSCILR